ncbi:hypothetical protein [Allofournierella massiliensis]|uniref:hypothetical protein n=1 Tax=Allofournierella massiliensis TaxID=1650663 RepID=UPI00356A166E
MRAANALANRTLSECISDSFCEFFSEVLRKALELQHEDKTRPVFIAVITRRCFVLFFAYYEMLCWYIHNPTAERPSPWKDYSCEEMKELAEIFRNCVITDNAAWAMAYDIIQHYVETGVFPQLITVDELLFHGRALNGFLYGLEKRLLHAKSLYEDDFVSEISDETFIKDVFLESLTICVAGQNVGSSVLLPRYKKKLAENTSSIDLGIEEWRNHSIAYAQYVSVCGINNTGFTLGIAIPADQDKLLSNSFVGSHFTKVHTQLQNIEQDTWVSFYPNIEHPQMICTVRCKQSKTDIQKNMYVPFLILDHINPNQLLKLHRQLVQEANEKGKQKIASLLTQMDNVLSIERNGNEELLVPWLAQTTDLVLTSWLMKRFLYEVKNVSQEEIDGIWKDAIAWEQLAANFCSYCSTESTIDLTINALKELWSWEPSQTLEEYFAVYTDNAKSLSVNWMDLNPADSSVVLDENSEIVQCLEDTIAKIGLEAERNAYTLYGSGLPFSDEALSNWGDNHSLDTLLEKLRTQLETYDLKSGQINLYQVAAIITQAMDLGLLGMNTILDKQPCEDRVRYRESPRELYTRQRAGEASLFLLPIRYQNLLPVLSEIQEKRMEDFEGAALDLNNFVDSLVADSPMIYITHDICMSADQLKRSLCSAYKMLVLGGQKLKEWQCSLYDRRIPFENQAQIRKFDQELKIRFLWGYQNL